MDAGGENILVMFELYHIYILKGSAAIDSNQDHVWHKDDKQDELCGCSYLNSSLFPGGRIV